MNKKLVFLFCIVFALPLTIFNKDKIYTATTYISSNYGRGRANQKPAEFKVPKGKFAIITDFYSYSPRYGESKKLGKNIYCISTRSYMIDREGHPFYKLPPGKYRFFIEGLPGAYGKLKYRLIKK